MEINQSTFQPHWFGDYEFLRLLGVGGMAEVFLGRTTGAHGFQKLVVIKRILHRLKGDPRFVHMFVAEAKRTVQLQHANIVQILSLEEHADWPFIVMEYVHGKNLQQVLQGALQDRVGLPVDFGIHCVIEMLKGLGYAHDARDSLSAPMNLIHRDITPENIFVSFDGEVKLGDFGVAHSKGSVDRKELRGKLGYIAPELFEEVELDQRSDIFSAGVVLWEALAWRKLFTGTNEAQMLFQVCKREIEPPSKYNSKLSPDLDKIALRALDRDREGRFQSAQALEEALSDYLYARRQRWTRRRIADVMAARYPEDARPPELPPELPRNARPPSNLADPVDFSDASAEHMLHALRGSLDSQIGPIASDADDALLLPFDSQISQADQGIPVEDDFDDYSTEVERVVVSVPGMPQPVPLSLEGLVDKVADAPGEIEAVSPAAGKPGVARDELAKLLYWDALREFPALPAEASTANNFENMSPTRLLYEASVRRLTGTLLLEDPPTGRKRLLLLREGMPLYVYSNDPRQGLLPMLLRYKLLEPTLVFRGVVKSLGEHRPLDDALTEALREQGKVDAAATVHRFVAGLLMRRLFAVFSWPMGRYQAYADLAAHTPYIKPLPSMLGYLISAARHAYEHEGLFVRMVGRGSHAVVLSRERESHIAALRLTPQAQELVAAIDGKRSLPQILRGAGAESAEDQHAALALFYTLSEARIVELI